MSSSKPRLIDSPQGRLDQVEFLLAEGHIDEVEAAWLLDAKQAARLGPAFEAGMAPDPIPFWVHDPRGLAE